MPSLISCPGCEHKLMLPQEVIGQRVRCPKCLIEFQAQANATPAMEIDPQGQPAPALQTAYSPVGKTALRATAPSLYCIECGTRYPRTDEACPKCGCRNLKLLAERLPPIQSWLATAGAILILLGALVLVAGIFIDYLTHTVDRAFCIISLTVLIESIALIFCTIWLYQAWRLVAHGDEKYAPGLMVGLMFVPFFNFYWIFRAIPGLSSALQRKLNSTVPTQPSAAGWIPGLIACILVLIPYLQPIAVCMFSVWILIANHAAHRLVLLHEKLQSEA